MVDMELKKRLLTDPGDMLEFALNAGDIMEALRRVILLYGLRGLPTRNSDS